MRCSYTQLKISRRFGVPQAYEAGKPLQLIGTYGSIGILIRYLCSKVDQNGLDDHITSSLSRIGAMIGRPVSFAKNGAEIEYSKEELSKLTELAAPETSLLDINGGTMTIREYLKRDKTWNNPEFEKYGQTQAEVQAQKDRMNAKRVQKRESRIGKKDELYRIFFFGLTGVVDKKNTTISRISYSQLEQSGFFEKAKDVRHIPTDKGLKICYSGGSLHNKVAAKKFYGKDWVTYPPIKGDAVIFLTHEAPLVMDEYMEEDSEWLANYRRDKIPTVDKPVDISKFDGPLSKKKKRSADEISVTLNRQ